MSPAPDLVLVALALVFTTGGCATAGAVATLAPDPALTRCDADTAARLRFLEERLEGHARYATRWLNVWNSINVGGAVVSGSLAGVEDGRGERANQAVNAAKAGIHLARNLWSPPIVKEGARALRAIDTASPDGCARRLAQAEELLRLAVEDAQGQRKSWIPHLANLALNLVGALIVAKGFDAGSGWSSGAIGFVVGEIRIWTYPWQAEDTWKEYASRFPPAPRLGAGAIVARVILRRRGHFQDAPPAHGGRVRPLRPVAFRRTRSARVDLREPAGGSGSLQARSPYRTQTQARGLTTASGAHRVSSARL